MKSLRTMLAIAMLLPFAGLAAAVDATAPSPAMPTGIEAGEVASGTTTGFDCCWVFMYGQWWCIPC